MGKKLPGATPEQIEENWNGIWKEILEKPDGSIDKEQLKLELMDFSEMIGRMGSLTSQITGNRLSYPTYPVETILQVAEEVKQEEEEDRKKDDKECGVCSYCNREFDEETDNVAKQ